MEIVVEHMPADGNHETRTLEFDSKGRLYVKYGKIEFYLVHILIFGK